MEDWDPHWLSEWSLENSVLDKKRFYEIKFVNSKAEVNKIDTLVNITDRWYCGSQYNAYTP